MKNTTITILSSVIGLSFVCLLLLQLKYIDEIFSIRRQHFDESVNRSLYRTSHQLEVQETIRYFETGYNDNGAQSILNSDSLMFDSLPNHVRSFTDSQSLEYNVGTNISDKFFTKKNHVALPDDSRTLHDVINERYLYEKAIIDEIIYSRLYTASNRPLYQRVDFDFLDQTLRTELHNNGIDIPYHFIVTTSGGREIYRCSDYESKGDEHSYVVPLFRNDPVSKMGMLKIHFPDMGKYVFNSIWYIVPSLIFTLILFVTFVVSIVLLFRQKKLTELKNDFINNMTHEFKTPISTISLAAQMLGDENVNKSAQMFKRLSSTIIDETKRLRFQVEKVLQLSMYDHQKTNLKMKELNVNDLITGVVYTFALKVEKNGGKIISELNADKPIVLVDEMHFTNVIFNLMDNAVKYRREDSPLELKISTWNENKSSKLCISIQDNGIGIKKDDLKKIFDRFFRVHTGNVHDVKGFGLGLAYVKKIITDHKAAISVESELGVGTKFVIKMPMSI